MHVKFVLIFKLDKVRATAILGVKVCFLKGSTKYLENKLSCLIYSF